MGCEEGAQVAEMDLSLLDIAEDNYKVRADIQKDD